MAVQRFRTVEEMAAAPVIVPPGEGFERFVRHCARYWTIAPRVYPRGVFRFRSIGEAQAARDRVTERNVNRLRERKGR
ncbi:MAG: hypothetical protein LJF30_22445 [Acidobacteria bacterium]|nr:hypothetical protein [Acidobacteriota bacterium]